MLGIPFCGCGWVPVRSFLCLIWHETHTKGLRARPDEDESRQGPRAVNSRKQWAEEASQQKSGEGDGKRKGTRSWVGQRERISQHSWWLCGNFARIHAHDSPQIHRKLQKWSQTSPFLHLELTQVRACLVFFSSTLSVVYVVSCVFVKQCEIPLAGDERNH